MNQVKWESSQKQIEKSGAPVRWLTLRQYVDSSGGPEGTKILRTADIRVMTSRISSISFSGSDVLQAKQVLVLWNNKCI
jgi:hypothetical protein